MVNYIGCFCRLIENQVEEDLDDTAYGNPSQENVFSNKIEATIW